MLTSNIVVLVQDNKIKLRFDSIYIANSEPRVGGTILEKLCYNFYYNNKAKEQETLNRRVNEKIEFFKVMNDKNEWVDFSMQSSSYEIPCNPNLAIEFLYTIERHVQGKHFEKYLVTTALIQDKLVKDGKNKPYLPGTIAQHFDVNAIDLNQDSVVKHIITLILSTARIEAYSSVYAALEKVLIQHEKYPSLTLMDCCDFYCRYDVTPDVVSSYKIGERHSLDQNYLRLFILAKKLFADNKIQEFERLIKTIAQRAKFSILEPCLGKKAHDGGYYKFEYTECGLLLDGKYTLRADGKLSLKVTETESYKSHYSSNQINHAILEPEMRFLANIANLSFEEGINFHDEIIFTKESSKKLIESGILIDVDGIKKLFSIKNNHRLFADTLYLLPKELRKLAADFACHLTDNNLDAESVRTLKDVAISPRL